MAAVPADPHLGRPGPRRCSGAQGRALPSAAVGELQAGPTTPATLSIQGRTLLDILECQERESRRTDVPMIPTCETHTTPGPGGGLGLLGKGGRRIFRTFLI